MDVRAQRLGSIGPRCVGKHEAWHWWEKRRLAFERCLAHSWSLQEGHAEISQPRDSGRRCFHDMRDKKEWGRTLRIISNGWNTHVVVQYAIARCGKRLGSICRERGCNTCKMHVCAGSMSFVSSGKPTPGCIIYPRCSRNNSLVLSGGQAAGSRFFTAGPPTSCRPRCA